MDGHDSGTAAAGVEFNARLARSDGESVAGVLYENLTRSRAEWLDDRVLPWFKGSPWPEYAANAPRCRDEVAIFQAVEAANIARDAGYVAEDRANWFADWTLRLTLGTAAGASRQDGLARYWRHDLAKRVDEFASVLAALLPEPVAAQRLSQVVVPRRFFWEAARISPACYFVRTLAPLLHFQAFVAVSTAFHDDSTAKEARETLASRDRSFMESLDEFVTGGGVNYIVAMDGAWLTSVSEPHGVILPIFTLREAADQAAGEGRQVVRIDNREVLAQTTEFQRLKVRYVAVISHAASGPEHEASLLPIDRFLQIITNAVDRSNAGDLARAYRKAVTA
jgi:hypothetical protein